MTRALLIGGSPGSGKTTVARAVADRSDDAVCIETDVFFDFVRNLIHPAKPEAHHQNHIVIAAYCRAAKAYLSGGYRVCLEGVLGPWLVPLVKQELGDFDYIVLHASLDKVQKRVAHRSGQQYVSPGVVASIHAQFERVLEEYADHVIDTESREVEEIVEEIERKRRLDQCVVYGARMTE